VSLLRPSTKSSFPEVTINARRHSRAQNILSNFTWRRNTPGREDLALVSIASTSAVFPTELADIYQMLSEFHLNEPPPSPTSATNSPISLTAEQISHSGESIGSESTTLSLIFDTITSESESPSPTSLAFPVDHLLKQVSPGPKNTDSQAITPSSVFQAFYSLSPALQACDSRPTTPSLVLQAFNSGAGSLQGNSPQETASCSHCKTAVSGNLSIHKKTCTHNRKECCHCHKSVQSARISGHQKECAENPNCEKKERSKKPCRHFHELQGTGNLARHDRKCLRNPDRISGKQGSARAKGTRGT
jgi:hypothetical protein